MASWNAEHCTALYRHYSEAGDLLYVGIAISPLARLCDHRAGSAWYDDICTIKIVRYPTREEAMEAELKAIREEKPLHNIAGAITPPPPAFSAPRRSAHLSRKLSARGVEVASKPGFYADGQGLYLCIKNGGKSWIFRYQVAKRRREMGLGSVANVSLAKARELARLCREKLADGLDPIDQRRAG